MFTKHCLVTSSLLCSAPNNHAEFEAKPSYMWLLYLLQPKKTHAIYNFIFSNFVSNSFVYILSVQKKFSINCVTKIVYAYVWVFNRLCPLIQRSSDIGYWIHLENTWLDNLKFSMGIIDMQSKLREIDSIDSNRIAILCKIVSFGFWILDAYLL